MKIKELQATLIRLHASWGQQWPGLPLIMDRCLAQLGYQAGSPMEESTQALHDCIQHVAKLIENDGQARAALNQEPDYHNRLHVANTLVALTCLLLLQRQVSDEDRDRPSHTEWMAMLTMLSHDLLHDGSVNSTESQIEARSVEYLKPLLKQYEVEQADQSIITAIILLTDASLVKGSHEKIKNIPFLIENKDCLTVLVQEADIIASALPDIGPLLTEKLASEWGKINYKKMHAFTTIPGRIEFLRNGALFSSPASQLLGIDAIKSAQLLALDE
jgi:hypothetical protein